MKSIDNFEIQKEIEKYKNMNYETALNLIFEWVKTGIITRKQFKVLLQANRDSYK